MTADSDTDIVFQNLSTWHGLSEFLSEFLSDLDDVPLPAAMSLKHSGVSHIPRSERSTRPQTSDSKPDGAQEKRGNYSKNKQTQESPAITNR